MLQIDKVSLGNFPTPLQYMEKLSKKFNYNLFIKRDDLTGLAFGGNKTRKLEYLIADALDKGAKAILTEGAAQSNHARQTAAAAIKYGLIPHLLLFKPQPGEIQGNLLLDNILGAKIHWIDREKLYEERLKKIGVLRDCHGADPYFIPMGGSNEIGLWGYIDAIDELKTQCVKIGQEFDYIVFASSSGGTQAGMILGKAIFGLKAQIIGIEIDKKMYPGKTVEQHIKIIMQQAVNDFGLKIDVSDLEINLVHGYNEAGYGVMTQRELNAINLMAQTEGIFLDPVYTGRAFGALIDMMEKDYFPKGSNILFWHTGGHPALFAYADQLVEKHEPGKDNKDLHKEINE